MIEGRVNFHINLQGSFTYSKGGGRALLVSGRAGRFQIPFIKRRLARRGKKSSVRLKEKEKSPQKGGLSRGERRPKGKMTPLVTGGEGPRGGQR